MVLFGKNTGISSDRTGTCLAPVSANNVNLDDLLIRVQQSATGVTYIVKPTETIKQPFNHAINENGLFRHVIKNLWQVYKYQQEYQSYLLGGLSEAEFLAIAEKYATSYQHLPASTLTWTSSVLINLLDNYLTSSDLSVLLNVDPFDMENALGASSIIHDASLEHREANGE